MDIISVVAANAGFPTVSAFTQFLTFQPPLAGPKSRQTGYVKGFGRRQAYESLRGPNPRAARASLWVFRLSAGPWMTRTAAKVAAEAVDRGYLQAFPAQVVGQIMAGRVNMVGCRRG